ncbi:MAG TPA: hypothetical protein VID28_13270 [Methylomirabilota bacterium]
MTRRLLLLNGLVVLLGCLFLIALVRELLAPLPLPAPGAVRPASLAPVAAPEPPTAPPVGSGAYLVIASKNLFSPTRSEGQGPSIAVGPKPVLHGVVMDGPRSRAYLEDPNAKRIFGYAVGDSVAGGRVQSINGDRVIIARPDGRIEVLLQDPDKPKPEPDTPAAIPPGGAPPNAPGPGGAAVPPPPGNPPAAAPGGASPSGSVTPPGRTSAPAAPSASGARATRRLLPVNSQGGPR